MKIYVPLFEEVLKNQGMLSNDFNMILESFDDAIEKFADEPMVDYDEAKEYVEEFKKLRNSKPKALYDNIRGVSVPAEKRQDILAYKSFDELKRLVDHVNQNVQNKEKKAKYELEVKGDVVYEDNRFKVYYMDKMEKCQAYLHRKELTGAHYKHCIGWDTTSNLFKKYNVTDRFTIYIVIDKPALAKELEDGQYDPPYNDTWHMCVVMVRFDDPNEPDETKVNYLLANANNSSGDPKGGWEDMVIQKNPRLAELDKRIFKVRDANKRHWLDSVNNQVSDLEYKKFDFHQKTEYVNMKCNLSFQLSDQQFKDSPDAIKQAYIGKMIPLSDAQLETIRNNEKMLKWYFINLTRRWGHVITQEFTNEFIAKLESEYHKITGEDAANVDPTDVKLYIDKYLKLSPLNLDLLKRYNENVFNMYGEIMKMWFIQSDENEQSDNKFYWYVLDGNGEDYADMLGRRLSLGKQTNSANLYYLRNKHEKMFRNYVKFLLMGDLPPTPEMAKAKFFNKDMDLYADTLNSVKTDPAVSESNYASAVLKKLQMQ